MALWNRAISAVGGRRAIVGLGFLFVAIAVGRAFVHASEGVSVGTIVIVFLLIGGPGFVLVSGGYRLPETDIRPEFYPTVAGWCLGGLGAILAILTLYHLQPDDSLRGSGQSVLILSSLASAGGFTVGVHDGRARTRARELERRNQELQQAQAELERAVGRLRESNKRLEQFAYAASHDLQEPLRMVSSYLQLIERRYDDDLDDEGMEFLEFAVDGAERMREMIDGLLEYSRVETQGEPFESVDLDEVVGDARKDLEVSIRESGATIEVEELPTVEGDERQVRQIFQNLLSNAIEYSGDEPPRVRVSAARTDGTWTISVTDEGIGIEPNETDRVFEVFHRLHTHDEHAGTGIGLALCKRIVERHGGEIWIDSDGGDRTSVSFTLPSSDETETSAEPKEV